MSKLKKQGASVSAKKIAKKEADKSAGKTTPQREPSSTATGSRDAIAGKDKEPPKTASAKPSETTGGKSGEKSGTKNDVNAWGIGVQRQVVKQIAIPDLTLVFDTETTGLPNNSSVNLDDQPRIIEFGAHKYEGRKLVESIQFLINPGHPIDDKISRITGITNEMLKDQPRFTSYLPTLKEAFLGVRRVVGHNVWFDLDLLKFELERLGKLRVFPWCPEAIDTIDMSMDIRGYRLKLGELHEHFFCEGFPAHRAMPDVIACSRCYFHMLDQQQKA